jgi:hypothetical protein
LPIRSVSGGLASAEPSGLVLPTSVDGTRRSRRTRCWRIRFRWPSTRIRADRRSSGDKMVEIVGLYASIWAVVVVFPALGILRASARRIPVSSSAIAIGSPHPASVCRGAWRFVGLRCSFRGLGRGMSISMRFALHLT